MARHFRLPFLCTAATLLAAGRFTSAQETETPTYAPTDLDPICAAFNPQEFNPLASPAEDCTPGDLLDPNPACFRPSWATQTCQFRVRCDTNSYFGDEPKLYLPGTDLPGIASVQVLTDETYFPAWSCTRENGCYDSPNYGPRGSALLFAPEVDEGFGAVLFIHGGSWYYSAPGTDGYPAFAARMAREWKMPVLSIDYPLAPIGDAAAMQDATARALAYLGETYPGRKFVVSGDSSGGGTALAAVTAQASRLEGFAATSRGNKFSAAVLYSPWINLLSNAPTYFSQNFCLVPNGPAHFLWNGDVSFSQPGDQLVSDYAANARDYLGNNTMPLDHPIYNPLFFLPHRMHWEDLPPIQIHMASTEVLQADCSMYASRVCGVSNGAALAECHQYDGMFHVSQMSSEGCGSEQELVLANASMRSSKNFVMDAVKDPSSSSQRTCGTVMHYEYPRGRDSVEYFESLARVPSSAPTTKTTAGVGSLDASGGTDTTFKSTAAGSVDTNGGVSSLGVSENSGGNHDGMLWPSLAVWMASVAVLVAQ